MGAKMIDDEKQQILDLVGQKWIFEFDMPDGSKGGGICNTHLVLPDIINKIRGRGGKNIVIRDKTIFFVDDKED